LAVDLAYNGSSLAPTNPGSYVVVGTINDPDHYGSVTNALMIGMPPQNFSASGPGSNGPHLALQLTGTPNYPYLVQTATNLIPPVNWQTLLTNPADANGCWRFCVTSLTDVPGRFYRAVAQ
jgi:hypothetical protein